MMAWGHKKGAGDWCPENDGAYRAEQAALHETLPCHGCGKFTAIKDAVIWNNHLFCPKC